jgi:hypothetical protein
MLAVLGTSDLPHGLRNSLIVYQLHGLANHGLELPKIHWMEG